VVENRKISSASYILAKTDQCNGRTVSLRQLSSWLHLCL